MPKAYRVLTASGTLTTCLSCWDGEEVSRVEVEVPFGTYCEICLEEIEDEEKEK